MINRKLYIVLTRTHTVLSRIIHNVTNDEYTHASLALDKNLEQMFSFGRKNVNNPFLGCFRHEKLNEGLYGRHKKLPGLVLELSVSEGKYIEAKSIIEEFSTNEHKYSYNYMGLFNGLLGISVYNQNRFLCSEFVYYVLYQSGICDLKIPRNLVRPQDLLCIGGSISYKGDLKLLYGENYEVKYA